MTSLRNLGILALLLGILTTPGSLHAGEADALLANLGQGGYVIYWRHAATDRRERDQDFRDMDRCEFQRNLDSRGRAEAERIGAEFARRGIPVGAVLTSDFCRNRDTARIAFGRYERVPDLWNLPAAHSGPLDRDELVAALRQRLSTPPEDPSLNTVIVGHNLNLQAAARVVLGEGGMAIFRPLGDAGFELVGTLTPEDFP